MTFADDCPPALREALTAAGLDTVEGVFAYGGGDDLIKRGLGSRQRTRIEIISASGQRQVLYLKRYGASGGCGCRGGGGEALIEFRNVEFVRRAGVRTMQALAWGHDSASRSYIIVTAVPGEAMERCIDDFIAGDPEGVKTAELTSKLASLVRQFHEAGLVHRDLYASHIFLDERRGLDLYLIDLARVFRPVWRRSRWRVKDLAALRYSMPPRWVKEHWASFLRQYLAGQDHLFYKYDRKIAAKVAWMRRRADRRAKKAALERETK